MRAPLARNLTRMPQASLLSVLRERAGLQPDDTAFTYGRNHNAEDIESTVRLNVADLVLVQPDSIPTTTSGKIRRSACVEHYRSKQFTRLDA
jgi:fatty acid CoA ligase FadD21